MKEESILYQIKDLERVIFRKLLVDGEIRSEDLEPKMKITPTQMEIIMYVLEHQEDAVLQKELEDALNLRRATVSGVLQTMEKNDLIERMTDSEDTRTKKVVLKQRTIEIFEKNKRKFDRIEEKLVNGIPEEKIKIFLEVIEMFKKNIE